MQYIYYNPDNGENPNWLWIVFLTAMFVVASLCMSSCTTTKTVTKTEYVTVHDTLITHQHDTIIRTSYKERTVCDTILTVKVVERTLNEKGDVVKEKETNDTYHGRKTSNNDSISLYKAMYDSLLNVVKADTAKSATTQEKPLVTPLFKSATKGLLWFLTVIVVLFTIVVIREKSK